MSRTPVLVAVVLAMAGCIDYSVDEFDQGTGGSAFRFGGEASETSTARSAKYTDDRGDALAPEVDLVGLGAELAGDDVVVTVTFAGDIDPDRYMYRGFVTWQVDVVPDDPGQRAYQDSESKSFALIDPNGDVAASEWRATALVCCGSPDGQFTSRQLVFTYADALAPTHGEGREVVPGTLSAGFTTSKPPRERYNYETIERCYFDSITGVSGITCTTL